MISGKNKFSQQIKDTFKKAFFDLLEEKVGSSPPDYDWLTRLYSEIKGKLTSLLRDGSQLRKEIEESMDMVLFKQMITNDAFNPNDFYKLVFYVFEKCKQLQAPYRDAETDQKLKEIMDHINGGNAQFSTIVPMFIKNANHCLDNIYTDISNLKKEKN